MLHIVILVAWYICDTRQQRLAWYYCTAVVQQYHCCGTLYYWCVTPSELPNQPSQRSLPIPQLRPRMYMFLELSYYIVYQYCTRYNSNRTAVCTAVVRTTNITLFAHEEHNHRFPDFLVQQYSYFLLIVSTMNFLFSRDSQALHMI